ncbi:hypothetical protein B7R54_18020 [Subtercola boreus]|uniref:Uncharacterized protein n=1 Tax=Subtercola boreus TaxID=120213 RepID=A0A3E0VLQ8_9MICO|nr:HTH domain-containing protein [Subtercola boreus]RFA10892.1 hypothetical protein B7R54_18020 [Subtercola boreus]TQL55520.1 hypothetical protein FB464_3087 [Subtercola boreus]
MNPADELRILIGDGGITEDAVRSITGITTEKLRSFLNQAQSGMVVADPEKMEVLSTDESMRLSILVAQLTAGFQIDDDERLTAILESLTLECGLTVPNIARLTGLEIEDLESGLHDPASVPIEKKYALALRSSYVINAVGLARTR